MPTNRRGAPSRQNYTASHPPDCHVLSQPVIQFTSTPLVQEWLYNSTWDQADGRTENKHRCDIY